MKINGKYYAGIDYDAEPSGKTSHNGWSQSASEMHPIILTDEESKASLIESNINLKSAFDKVYARARYGELKLRTLEVQKIDG